MIDTNAAIGINTWVWHSPLTTADLKPRLRQIADWGFEAVELPLENTGDWDAKVARDLLQEYGLIPLVGCVFAPGRELAMASDDTYASTTAYMKRCVDTAAVVGARLVIGPTYTSVGRTGRLSGEERGKALRDVTSNLRQIADYAGDRGIVLGVEPLNRYETNLFNTADQLMQIMIDLPTESVGVNLDTYHMNIEEKSWSEPFLTVGERLVHLQVCANDRGAPGTDHLDWPTIGASLERIGYRGSLGIESFTAHNAAIATAASIWRPLASSQDSLAVDGLRFLKDWRNGWLDR